MTNKLKLLNKITVELQAMKEILYGSRMFSFNQIKDACEKAGVDKDIFTAIEAELIETFSRQDDHDCHASPEDGCQESWKLRILDRLVKLGNLLHYKYGRNVVIPDEWSRDLYKDIESIISTNQKIGN